MKIHKKGTRNMKYCSIILYLIIIYHASTAYEPNNILIIGAGYVGLITGACLAEINNDVTLVDIDAQKIKLLNKNIVPIFEPNLSPLIIKNIHRLRFLHSLTQDEITKAAIIFLCVGTPATKDGDANLTALYSAFEEILRYNPENTIICIKSTVPVGTHEKLKSIVTEKYPHASIHIVSNPEFLRQGSALQDFLTKNPIVLGSTSKQALKTMQQLYSPLLENNIPFIKTNPATAELIKYAWNAFSMIRIAYVNEIARACNAMNANIMDVIKSLAYSTKLLPTKKIRPGPGIGGSCLPKDTTIFVRTLEEHGLHLPLIKNSLTSNQQHERDICTLLSATLDPIQEKTITLLGLSFKANTDDLRNASSIVIVNHLLNNGVHIKVFDPCAMKKMQQLYPQLTYCSSTLEACSQSDAIVLLTEWEEFRNINFHKLKACVRQPVIFDMRNLWPPKLLSQLGFIYYNLGRII